MNIIKKVDWTDVAGTSSPTNGHASVDLDISLPEIAGILRRRRKLIGAVLAFTLMSGISYIAVTEPRYTAAATLMMDPQVDLLDKQAFGPGVKEIGLDPAAVESQAQILQSEKIALNVVRELNLVNRPDFAPTRSGLRDFVRHLLQGVGLAPQESDHTGSDGTARPGVAGALSRLTEEPKPLSAEERIREAVLRLWDGLRVRRIGVTYALEIAFTAGDRATAVQIANAYADAYILDQLNARYEAARRTAAWLQDRIAELKERAQAAENAVQDYKAKHNVVITGSRPLTDQQVGDISTQLTLARTQMAEAKARFDHIQDMNRAGILDASATDGIRNDVITKLRQQHYDASKREADWSARYGQNHPAAANLRNEMKGIQTAIEDELRRIAEAYRSDYEIAKARAESLQASLEGGARDNIEAGRVMVELKNLESTAQSSRLLYDSFLQKLNETQQRQTVPTTQARLITDASLNVWKSHPQTVLILGLSAFLGVMIGPGFAFLRERFNNAFRLPAEVEQVTGVRCLGVLPKVKLLKRPRISPPNRLEDRILGSDDAGLLRYAVEHPLSRFTEAIRFIKVAGDMAGHGPCKLMGVASALPHEGKSTVASNLAHLVAHAGSRTLLIDGDLRSGSLTRILADGAQAGLLEVLAGKATLDQVVWTDPVTKLSFLPAVIQAPILHTSDIISSEAMRKLLADARERYDYIVIDLPPIAPIVDVKAASHLIDSFVLVIEWGRTTQQAVLEALNATPDVAGRLLGTILNGADGSILKQLEAYKGRHFHGYYEHIRP